MYKRHPCGGRDHRPVRTGAEGPKRNEMVVQRQYYRPASTNVTDCVKEVERETFPDLARSVVTYLCVPPGTGPITVSLRLVP